MGITCAFIGRAGRIPREHGARLPPCQPHQITLGPASSQPVMRERMPWSVRMQFRKPDRDPTVLDHLIDAARRKPARPNSRPAGAARRHRANRYRLLGDLRRARLDHGRSVDLALLVQPAEELPKGPVAGRGRRGSGALKFGRGEGLDVVPVDAARGGGHTLADQKLPVVRVCPDRPRRQVGRL